MPSMTLTTDAANTAKMQAVVDFYNQRNGTTLTLKQWATTMLKEAYLSWNSERRAEQIPPPDVLEVT
jgi:hypothetical protein